MKTELLFIPLILDYSGYIFRLHIYGISKWLLTQLTQAHNVYRNSVCECTLLTLGAHAPEGYGSCPVCVSVCLSVRNLNLGTGASRGLNECTSK